MSYSSDLKKELTTLSVGKKCCQLAQITGFMRFAGSVTLSHGKMGIKISTDSPAIARLYVSLIKDYFGAKTSLSVLEPAQLQKTRRYELNITPEMNSEAILREIGILKVKEGSNVLTDGIDQDIIKKRCCKKAALRGIFLACGSINNPSRGYHLELCMDSVAKAKDVIKLINSFGIKSKLMQRRGVQVVYIKDGEHIEDFLAVIGASSSLFKLQEVRMTKEMRNAANRRANCDLANNDKSLEAAHRIVDDINYISAIKTLDFLPEKLRKTAILRKEHQEATLLELSQMFDPPISKAGLNHRLEKISSIAERIRKGEL